MNKKSNRIKNITTVLLALLLLGIAAGPASALPLTSAATGGVTGQVAAGDIALGDTSGNAVFNVTITEAAVADLTTGTHYINVTVPAEFGTPTVISATDAGLTTDVTSVTSLGFNSTTRNVTAEVVISGVGTTDSFYISFNVTAAPSVATGAKTFTTYLDGVGADANELLVTIKKVTVAGALNPLYVDVDGQKSEPVTALTITPTVAGDIGTGSSINITLSDANVTFDLSQTPDVVETDGITAVAVTKFTATEIGISVTGSSYVTGLITLGGVTPLRVNLSAGTPTTTVVNFTVKTTPLGGSLVTQIYDALDITLQTPNAVTITHNDVDSSVTVGTNVLLTAHAASANIANYGGWKINFTIITAPSPLTWTANGMNSSFSNTTLDQYEQVTTGSNGNANLNLKLSTRSSEEDSAKKTDVKVQLNGTAVAAVKLSDTSRDITTVDSFETHVNVTSDYESAVADGTQSILFTAQLRDQFDNFVQAGGNITSTFGVGLSGDALPVGVLPTAFAGGAITFSATDSTKEPVTATVTSIVIGIGPGSKTVNFVSDAYSITLSANRTSVPADSISVIRVYAQLRDASGALLALHKADPTWSYSQSNLLFGTGALFAGVNATGVNYVDLTVGVASGTNNVTIYYTNNTAVVLSKKITLYATQSVSATNTVASSTATSIKADGKTTFTVTVRDNYNQIIPNAEVTFKIEGGNGTLTNAANALQNATGKNSTLQVLSNATGGVAVEFFNRKALSSYPLEINSVNITVVDSSVVTKLSTAPYAVTVAAANASVIVLTPASQGIKNVNGTTATIAISLKDAYTNTVTDNLVVNVTNLNPVLGDLSTDATGQITLASGAGNVVFTVDSAPLEDSANIQFDAFTTYNPTLISVNVTGFIATVTTSGPTGVIVTFNNSNPVVGDTVMASAQLTAAGGALSIPDKVLTFTVYKGSATVPLLINVTSTNTSGIATYNFSVTEAGTYSVFAKNTSLGLSNSSNIIFAGTIVSVSVVANGTSGSYSTPVNSTVTINATAKDALGNVAVGATQTVDFLVNGSSIGSAPFTSGVASVTLTKSVAGTYTVLAYVNSTLTATVDVTFTAAAVPVLTVSASPTNVTVGTPTNVTFTVTPALSGVLVTLSGNATGSGTTTNGSATISVNATSAGAITATASLTGYTSGTTTITAQVGPVTAGTIAGTVTNASSGLPLQGATVTAANATFSTSTATNATGYYTITNLYPGPYNVTASLTGYNSSSENVTVTSGNTTTQNFALPPTPVVGPTPQSITIDPTSETMTVNQTKQFNATLRYSDGTTTNITAIATWNSSNTSVAVFLTTPGVLKAIGNGTTQVTASSAGLTSNAAPVLSNPNGDVTANGDVDSIDAMFVAQLVAETRTSLPNNEAGDVAPLCNGLAGQNVDSIDAMFLAQYVAGTRPSLTNACSSPVYLG